MMPRPRPAHLVLVASAIALVAIPLGVLAGPGSSSSPENLGDRPRQSVEATVAQQPVSRIGSPVREPSRLVGVAPTFLTIDSLGIEAPVDAVGVEESGWVEIPEDVARVGWYRYGSGIGSDQGSAVLVGHRDGFNQGAGAFYAVGSLTPGDSFTVTGEDQRTYTYEVVARETFAREDLPMDELFRESGSPVLTLISCIGYFDREAGGYQENVVVTAVLHDKKTTPNSPTSHAGPI